MWIFWIETITGEVIEWRFASSKPAATMYRQTEKRIPENVKRFGYGELI
jgi:hypothetical protein